jgi:serine/threonine protein phosphatase PrpC
MDALNAAGWSDVGRVRSRNEDRFFVDVETGLFIVADGMGGHPGGDVAAAMLTRELPPLLADCPHSGDFSSCLRFGITETGRRILAAGHADPARAGMGTTVVLAWVRGRHAFVAHVGDSRAYLFRAGRCVRLTRDHSLVQAYVESGELTEAEAAVHPYRSVLLRSLGNVPAAEVDVRAVTLEPSDRLFLCSDGLTGALGDTQLDVLLGRFPEPERACRALVDAANDAGGEDNVTAVVIDCAPD